MPRANKRQGRTLSLNEEINVEITLRTFLMAAGIIAAGFILFQIKVVFLIVFLSYIVMATLRPIVDFLVSKFKFNKAVAIISVYLFVIVLTLGLLAAITLPLVSQSVALVERFPSFVEELRGRSDMWAAMVDVLRLGELSESLSVGLGKFLNVENLRGALDGIFGVFGVLISAVSAVIISGFLLSQRDDLLKQGMEYIADLEERERIRRLIINIEKHLGAWSLGWFLRSITIGVLTWISLALLGLPFALPLALFAGVTSVVPTIGAIVGIVPALFVAVAVGSVWQVVAVISAFVLIGVLETNFIIPKIMEEVVGVNPLITLIAFLVGIELAGIAGALIALPVFVIAQIIANFIIEDRKRMMRKRR